MRVIIYSTEVDLIQEKILIYKKLPFVINK